jgi:hypothetical protein
MFDKEQSIEILINVANLAQQKGILSLKDAAYVNAAVESLEAEKEKEKLEKQEPVPPFID